MGSTERFFEAIDAGEADRVRSMVAADPELASARDAQGVSALMRARYRLDPALVDAVMIGAPDLDVFDAASIGDVDRLRQLLDGDPSLATAFSGDGFTALHFPAFFGGSRRGAAAARTRSGRRCARTGLDDRHAAQLRGLRASRGRGAPPPGCGRRSGRPAGERLDPAAFRGAQRRPRTGRAAARARRRPRRDERRRRDRSLHGRGGRERGSSSPASDDALGS